MSCVLSRELDHVDLKHNLSVVWHHIFVGSLCRIIGMLIGSYRQENDCSYGSF